MNQHRFATSFEKIIKPRLARDLGLHALKQNRNVDYVTNYGNLIELKIRKLRDEKNGEGFLAPKKQYSIITKKYMQESQMPLIEGHEKATFSYLFLGYNYDNHIESVKAVDHVINNMKLNKVFLVDHSFIPKNDLSGDDSRFYRVLVKTLEKNVKRKVDAHALGMDFDLKLVGNQEYLPLLACSLS